jgi:hypothetical protein
MKYSLLIIAVIFFYSCKKETSFSNQKDISNADYSQLIALSDTSDITSENDIKYKLDNITAIFHKYNDNRGIFSVIYKQIIDKAVLSIHNEPEKYDDLEKAKAITIAFAKRYYYNLHDHLLGQKSPEYHWKQYYVICFSNQPKLRMATAGLNAHLTVDLARAVADVHGQQTYKKDFFQFGEALVKASPNIIEELQSQYGVESADFFSGFFIGDIIDPIFGEGTTTEFTFQFIRLEAFNNAQLLQGPRPDNAQQLLYNNWKAREKLLDDLVEQGFIK